jgi:hypothetical protein
MKLRTRLLVGLSVAVMATAGGLGMTPAHAGVKLVKTCRTQEVALLDLSAVPLTVCTYTLSCDGGCIPPLPKLPMQSLNP